MNSTKTNLYQSALLLGFAVFLWNMLFVWQGLDFTDMGYSLTFYQQFYSSPSPHGMGAWLNNFLGHWLGLMFGGGVVGYKTAAAMIYGLGAVIVSINLKTVFKTNCVFIFVFIGMLFSTKAVVNWVDYNNLTFLFYCLGGTLLFHGLLKPNNWKLLLLSGVILSGSIFIRFPNIMGIFLIAVIPLYAYQKKWPFKTTFIRIGIFVAGLLLGTILILGLIFIHGHLNFYLKGIWRIIEMGMDQNSHHAGSLLMKKFIRDHLKALKLSAMVLAGVWSSVKFAGMLLGGSPKILIISIGSAGIILSIAFAFDSYWIWAVPGTLYLLLLWIMWRERNQSLEISLLAIISFLILLFVPLGSNNGIRNAIHASMFVIPFVLSYLWHVEVHKSDSLTSNAFRLASLLLIVAFFTNALTNKWFYTYRDSFDRLEMVHAIDHPLLIGTYTTESRAKVVEELLTELEKYVKPGDVLLAYPEIPTLHYLTQTIPLLDNPWPRLYSKKELQNSIEKMKDKSIDNPVVVVRSRGANRTFSWPDDRDETRLRWQNDWKLLDDFVTAHNYEIVWQNYFFEILLRP